MTTATGRSILSQYLFLGDTDIACSKLRENISFAFCQPEQQAESSATAFKEKESLIYNFALVFRTVSPRPDNERGVMVLSQTGQIFKVE